MSDTKPADPVDSTEENINLGESFQTAALVIPLSVVRAWVVSDMWSWFVVPLGVPVVSVGQMFGIIMMMRIIHMRDSDNNKKLPAFKDAVQKVIVTCISYWVIWWIAKGVYLLAMV